MILIKYFFMTRKVLTINDAAEAIQKIRYCIGIMKDPNHLKSDVNVLEIVSILEKNSNQISEYVGTVRDAGLGSEYLD